MNHPFHLHGYQMFVTGMGSFADKPMSVQLAKNMSQAGTLPRLAMKRFPLKDTISVPSKGWTIFRFKADNPGWWLLHCHYGEMIEFLFDSYFEI